MATRRQQASCGKIVTWKLAANHCHRLIPVNPNQRRLHHSAIKVPSASARHEFLSFAFESFQPTARSV